ncbi:hypothetical protein EVAR_76328_1 [Eumeta japonica]|uniref:Uncharacterized protein n=1 Tax=Eumeta variegata TaxID=151549 RepID=A0A4C1T7J0_EUMVA|nr:hypothetical protein EVAR_76328_1 [Eumeta japonica]
MTGCDIKGGRPQEILYYVSAGDRCGLRDFRAKLLSRCQLRKRKGKKLRYSKTIKNNKRRLKSNRSGKGLRMGKARSGRQKNRSERRSSRNRRRRDEVATDWPIARRTANRREGKAPERRSRAGRRGAGRPPGQDRVRRGLAQDRMF